MNELLVYMALFFHLLYDMYHFELSLTFFFLSFFQL